VAEDDLESVIVKHEVDQVVFAYSDVSHEHVMHRAARALASGADFRLLGPRSTMLRSRKPVISICAVRTGAGKSPAARQFAMWLREQRHRVAVIRHPMPYGNLVEQTVQRFANLDDLQRAHCTIEEREEYEPHISQGDLVFAGVDYEKILRLAESEADVIIWDGGNNDIPFFESDLEIVLVDPHRAGHEESYFPGEVNLRRADVLVITKMDSADPRHPHAGAGQAAGGRSNGEGASMKQRLSFKNLPKIQAKRFKKLRLEKERERTDGRSRGWQETISSVNRSRACDDRRSRPLQTLKKGKQA
jgi:predicted GTPase